MNVSVVSMPEGVVTRTDLSAARERLAASDFVIVDIDLGEEPEPDEEPGPEEGPAPGGEPGPEEEPLFRGLGLDDEVWEWLGRPREPVRVEYRGDIVGCVVPVVDGSRIVHVHLLASERHLVTVHHGPVEVIETFVERLPQDRPADAAATVFLFLHDVLEGFRRAASQALLEVEDIEEAMFEQWEPRDVHRLAQVRRRAAQLHRAFRPYAAVAQEFLARRGLANRDIPEERRALHRLHESTVRLVVLEIESLRDETRRAADSYASLVADRQNLVINRLAIVSVIFLPLSFLTGFFGMNFGFMSTLMSSEKAFLALGIGMQVCALFVALYFVLYRTHWRQLRGGAPDDDDADRRRRRRLLRARRRPDGEGS
ncbi:CorA family divalent cation transporter [Streptomyces sp. NPDC004667]|uniref:magnesium transporter CorA family protein n=1 Tax=Streptomyces sp. NPDC004667 TaxID=3154285 RepID=UPI0033A5DD27